MVMAYSIRIKRVLLLDVLTFAILYTMRVIAGRLVTDIPFSVWLLSFAFFLFLSLAFCKRATELFKVKKNKDAELPGRGYRLEDLQIITTDPEVPSQQITEFSPRICLGCSISSRAYLALAMTDYPELLETAEHKWK